MEIVKSVANIATFLLDPGTVWTRIDITVGENFRTLSGASFFLNETPFIEAALVPFSNLVIDAGKMNFDAKIQKTRTKFEVNISKNKAALLLADFIRKYNEEKFNISTVHRNSVQIKIEKKYLTIRLEFINEEDINIDNKKWLIISFNKFGQYVQIKEPCIPQKRFEQIKEISLDELTLKVQCGGKDVWSEDANNDEKHHYEWILDIQPEFIEIITGLLQTGINEQSKNFKR